MKIFKITSLYKFFYILVIAGLYFINYTRKDISTYDIGKLTVTETSFISEQLIPKKMKSLDVNYKGLSFFISKASPIIVTTDDGIIRKPKITGTENTDDSLKVFFDNNISIIFKIDKHGERLTISSFAPKVFPSINHLSIPYKLDSSLNIETTDLSYTLSSENEEFHLKLNNNYILDPLSSRIDISVNKDKLSTLTFSYLDTQNIPLAEQWYMRHIKTENESLINKEEFFMSKTRDSINRIFRNIRYNPPSEGVSESWENLPNQRYFTENDAIVYLAEGMLNGNYSNRYNKIKGLGKKFPLKFGYNSTPFMGNIVKNGRAGMIEDNRKLALVQKQIRNASSNLFEEQIPRHFFDGNKLNILLLESTINNADKSKMTLKQLSTSLYHLLMALKSDFENSQSRDSIKEITDRIINKMVWDDTGLYLTDDETLSDQLLNLKIGQLLIEASQHETSEYSSPIGEELIITYINNSRSNGDVPKSYNIKNGEFSSDLIPREDSFLLLSDNKHIPHYIQDKGFKIWTISDSIEINVNQAETRITVSYPVESNTNVNSHFFVISGVKQYNQLYFKGKLWRADPKFESYGVGYYYEQSTQLLFFMPNHYKEREEIIMRY